MLSQVPRHIRDFMKIQRQLQINFRMDICGFMNEKFMIPNTHQQLPYLYLEPFYTR
jgi:hypothetical protein